MKKLSLLFVGITALAMAGCANSKQKQSGENTATDTVSIRIETGYYGTYEGVLPCADCEGIKTVLSINEDTTYGLKSEYLGEKDGSFEENGTYRILDGNVIELITPSSGNKTYYKILEGAVALTADSTGTLAEGELAEMYVLKKQ